MPDIVGRLAFRNTPLIPLGTDEGTERGEVRLGGLGAAGLTGECRIGSAVDVACREHGGEILVTIDDSLEDLGVLVPVLPRAPRGVRGEDQAGALAQYAHCLLYTSDA